MEIRTLELKAEGASIGDTFSASIEVPGGRLHLDERVVFRLLLTPDTDSGPPQTLSLERCAGLEVPDDILEGVKGEKGDVSFDIPLILRGEKGESVIKIVIKGEEYGATLAFSEVDVDVGTTKLGAATSPWPVRWDGSSPLEMELILENRGKRKVSVDHSVKLISDDGRGVMTFPPGSCSVREKKRIRLRASPEEPLTPRELAARIDLVVEGEHQTSTVEKAVLPEKEREIKVICPGRLDPGEKLVIELRDLEGEREITVVPGEGEPVAPLETNRSDAGIEAIFELPGELKGMVQLRVLVDGREVSRSPLFMESSSDGTRPVVRARPDRARPGDEVSVEVELKGELPEGDTVVTIKPEMEGASPITIGIPANERKGEGTMAVPSGSPAGSFGGNVTVISGERTLFNGTIPPFVHVSMEAELGIRIMTPWDPGRGNDDGWGYLFPGESVISRRKYSGITLLTLDTGRVLVVGDDDEPLPAGEEDCGPASRVILLDTFLGSILEDEALSLMESAFGGSIELPHTAEEGEIGDGEGGGGFSGMLASHLAKEGKDPALRTHPEGKKDPVTELSASLRGILGPAGIGEGANPAEDLRDLVEILVKRMRTERDDLDPRLHGGILAEISRRGARALKMLKRSLGRDEPDVERISVGLRKVLFYLFAHSLVRTEMVSSWSDPVVSVWDQLNTERKKAVKTEVQTLLDLAGSVRSIYEAAVQRWEAYRENLGTRKKMKGIREIEIRHPGDSISGPAGDVWSMMLTLRAGEGAPPMELEPYILLPGPSWILESPSSSREGRFLVLDRIRLAGGERRDLEMRIRSPPSVPKGRKAMIYLRPVGCELEVEP